MLVAVLFSGSRALAADEAAYTTQTLPFDANTASPTTGWLSGLTSIRTLDLGESDPVTVVFTFINLALTLLGMVFLVLLLYAGVIWVLARGNEEEITRAKTTLTRALVGLVIILSSYGISWVAFTYISYFTTY